MIKYIILILLFASCRSKQDAIIYYHKDYDTIQFLSDSVVSLNFHRCDTVYIHDTIYKKRGRIINDNHGKMDIKF